MAATVEPDAKKRREGEEWTIHPTPGDIAKLLENCSHEDLVMRDDATDLLRRFAGQVVIAVMQLRASEPDVVACARRWLTGDLGEHAAQEMTKARTKFLSDRSVGTLDRREALRLFFDVSEEDSVALSAVLELGGQITVQWGQQTLSPKFLHVAVLSDPELRAVDARVIVFPPEAPVMSSSGTALAPSAVKPPTKAHATVHIVDVQAAGMNEDDEEDDDDRGTDEWSRRKVDKLLAHFPSLRARVQNGDLLEDSGEEGSRSTGWSHFHIDGETIRVVSLDHSCAGSTHKHQHRVRWDDYGTPNTAFFPVLTVFPCDYWNLNGMAGLEHVGGTTVNEGVKATGYWHGDEVLFDTADLFTEQGELAEHLTDGDWRLVQGAAQDGSMWSLLYNIPLVAELLDGHREQTPDSPFRLPVVKMADGLREKILPHVTPGFTAVMEGMEDVDPETQERLQAAAAVLVKPAK